MPPNLRRYPIIRSVALKGSAAYWRLRERYFQKYIFIHINKTGGRSIETALGCVYEHKTALQKIEEIGIDVWDRKFTFAFVRNPWDRVVSQFAYRKITGQFSEVDPDITFETWLKRVYVEKDPALINNETLFLQQSRWLTDDNGNLLVDFVGRFEELEEDFKHVCGQVDVTATLPHRNRSSRDHYPSYYTPETTALVSRVFAEDIERFHYSFDA